MINGPSTYVDISKSGLAHLKIPTEMNLCSQSTELLLSVNNNLAAFMFEYNSPSSHHCGPICDAFAC